MSFKALAFLLLVGCTGTRDVTLTPFPETLTDYTYHILLPDSTSEAVVIWYYAIERRENIVYHSGVVPIRTGTIKTEMFFAHSGTYILVVLADTPKGLQKIRYRYAVRHKF